MDENETTTALPVTEAAEYLGIHRRNLEKMEGVASREEYRTGRDGKKRRMRVYDISELDRIKEMRETPLHTPSVALATGTTSPPVTVDDLKGFGAALLDAMQKQSQKLLTGTVKAKKADIASYKDKFILNFTQARNLSALPADELKAGIESGRIAAKRRGETGNWQISNSSLKKFCDEYLEKEGNL